MEVSLKCMVKNDINIYEKAVLHKNKYENKIKIKKARMVWYGTSANSSPLFKYNN